MVLGERGRTRKDSKRCCSLCDVPEWSASERHGAHQRPERGPWGLGRNGDGGAVQGDTEFLGMGGGDGCTVVWMCVGPLSCALNNSSNGTFYVMYILPQ